MKIYEKLMNIQSELKAPKNNFNSFGNYKYRSCEDIVEALKPILKQHKAALTISDTIELIGDRFYLKATATLIDIEDGKEISTSAYAREEESKKGMDASQLTGSVSSYARKYALNGLFCIDDTKDSDSLNKHDTEATGSPMQGKINYSTVICNIGNKHKGKPIGEIAKVDRGYVEWLSKCNNEDLRKAATEVLLSIDQVSAGEE